MFRRSSSMYLCSNGLTIKERLSAWLSNYNTVLSNWIVVAVWVLDRSRGMEWWYGSKYRKTMKNSNNINSIVWEILVASMVCYESQPLEVRDNALGPYARVGIIYLVVGRRKRIWWAHQLTKFYKPKPYLSIFVSTYFDTKNLWRMPLSVKLNCFT